MLPKLTYALAGVSMALCISTAQAQNFKALDKDPNVINFGIISTESTQNLKAQWLPFLADMEKAIGKPVKAFFAPDYAGIIEGMRFGKVHVAWFGNKSGMEAVDRAGGEVFAQEIKANGVQGYYSHILVNAANNKINSLTDLLKCDKSLNFGIGDPNSTSGYLVPSFYVFAKNNVDPVKCFKTVRSANHETNLLSVANKQVDAAANNSEQMERAHKSAPEAFKNVKVIWTSPLIPGDPMVYRKDMSKQLKATIKAFFLGYGRLGSEAAPQKKVLAAMGSGGGGYTDSSNAQLYPIRQLALFKDKLKLQNDKRLDPADKTKRVAVIDAKLQKLGILADPEM